MCAMTAVKDPVDSTPTSSATTTAGPAGGSATVASRPLRTREHLGVIDSTQATVRVSPLAGSTLTAVETSMGRLVVALSTNPVHLLVISAPLSISAALDQGPALAEPCSPEAVAAVSRWIGRTITAVAVQDLGTLRIECGAEQVRIAADPSYEAWEVRGMDGGLLACLPGGAISLWAPTPARVPAAR